MKNNLKQVAWLQSQINKDKLELEREKSEFIRKIKQVKKEEIIPLKIEQPKKLTLWQRIKKALMG
jgi:hypothetical protein